MRRKNARRLAMAIGLSVLAGLVIYGAIDRKQSGAPSRAEATLAGVPDGLPLYRHLLREIPEVVSQIPCQCCGKNLDWCYRGGCPPS